MTTFYLAKNDHRWVTFISLKTITRALQVAAAPTQAGLRGASEADGQALPLLQALTPPFLFSFEVPAAPLVYCAHRARRSLTGFRGGRGLLDSGGDALAALSGGGLARLG